MVGPQSRPRNKVYFRSFFSIPVALTICDIIKLTVAATRIEKKMKKLSLSFDGVFFTLIFDKNFDG